MFWQDRAKPRRVREHFELVMEALGVIIENQEVLMSGQDRFNTALGDLGDKLAAHDVAVQKAIGDLKVAFATNDEAAFNAAADKLAAASGTLAKETADLAAADQPAAAPAPAPAPAPADPAPSPAPAPAPEPAPANPAAPDPSAPPPVSA